MNFKGTVIIYLIWGGAGAGSSGGGAAKNFGCVTKGVCEQFWIRNDGGGAKNFRLNLFFGSLKFNVFLCFCRFWGFFYS